jgi:two-component system sensor histidine kinase PilS (NtrC family)
MTPKPLLPDNMTSRLRWLMLSRVAIVTFLLGIATFVEVKGMGTLSAISASTLFKTILLTYILSIVYLSLLKYIRNLPLNIYIQSLCDVILITAMVYGTGGIQSIYSVFYPLVIIYSVLFLGRRGGLVIASAAGIFYGLFADLEFYGVIYPIFSIPIPDDRLNASYVFTRIITHILSFYFIALLTSFVVEQEKRTRTLLAEKQSAFDQLDILHRSIIESVDTGILSINPEGRIKSFNPAAAEITGFSFRDVENRNLAEVFPDFPPFLKERKSNAYKSVAKTRFETTFHAADGRSLILGGSLSPLRDPRGFAIGEIIIFQNLTEINEMRESLEKSHRLAFIGGMAASLAHEIRNPLASISGSIQMLKQDIPPTETNQKLMQIILRGKDQLESFLKDFLLMARPAPGVCEEIDVRGAIRDVLDSLRCVPDWPEPLRIDLIMPEKPLGIQANKTEIRQVFWNLILNAVQAMPEGGNLTVEARAARNDGRAGVEIKIGDTGCGIKNEDLRKIFEPFYTTRDVGTGLGLAVVSRILEGYRGSIDIQSEAGSGTTCRIWFPAQILTADGNRTIS